MAHIPQTENTICFGFQTAIRLLDYANTQNVSFRKVPNPQFPNGMAQMRDVQDAVGRLAKRWPELRLDLPLHMVSTTSTRNCRSTHIAYHRCNKPLHKGALLAVNEGVQVASAPLAFIQVAANLSQIDLLLLGYELCGTYRRGYAGRPTEYQRKPLMSVGELQRFLDLHPSLHGAKKARSVLRYLADGAESPREAQCALLFGLPVAMGGYGLGVPRMGHVVACTARARAITGSKTLRCDLFWPEARLDIEYQSHAFHEGELNRVHDSRRANALRSMGINVVPITDNELESLEACDAIANTVRRSLGKRNRTRVTEEHALRLRLRRQLGLPMEPTRTFPLAP